MKKIQWVLYIDSVTYNIYHKKIKQEKYILLYRFCSWVGLPVPLFTMLFIIAAIGCNFIGVASFFIEVVAYVFAAIVNLSIKALHKRNRPPNNNFWSPIPFDQYSFPSGHAAGTMAVAICLGVYIPKLLIPLLAWSILMSVSRFFGDYHHISDITVGCLVGILSGLILTNTLLAWIF